MIVDAENVLLCQIIIFKALLLLLCGIESSDLLFPSIFQFLKASAIQTLGLYDPVLTFFLCLENNTDRIRNYNHDNLVHGFRIEQD